MSDVYDSLRESKRALTLATKAYNRDASAVKRAQVKMNASAKAMHEASKAYDASRAAVIEANPEAFKL